MLQYRQKLAIYDANISKFERVYQLSSLPFQEQFESGKLGDGMDFFEWFSLCELRKDLLVKISKIRAIVEMRAEDYLAFIKSLIALCPVVTGYRHSCNAIAHFQYQSANS